MRSNENIFRCQHISFVVRRNKVVAEGINLKKTDAFAVRHGFQAWGFKHSETACIKSFKKTGLNPKDCQLINLRLPRASGGVLLGSRPCLACQRAAIKAGFSEVYFSVYGGQFDFIKL